MDWINKPCSLLDKVSEWSIYLIIFVLPFGKSIVEICIVTALVSLVLKRILAKEKIISENSNINVLLYLFLAASLISLINSEHLNLSIRAFFSKSLKFAALFLAAKEIINTRKKLNNFVIIASLSCVIILLDAFVQHYITHVDLLHSYPAFQFDKSVPQFLGFPTASFPFPNDFAAWMLMFVFPFCIFALLGKGKWQVTAFASAVSIGLLYFLALTKVRGAWLAFIISFALLALIKLKKLGVILLIVFILSAVLINRSLIPAIFSMTSINDRSVMWKNSVEIFKRHPILGNGLNTFYVNYMNIREDEFKYTHGSYAHNCYLQMAADIGLVGLLMFVLFAGSVILKAFKSIKAATDPYYYSIILGINMGLIAFLLHSFVDTNLYSLNLSALFWLSAGIMLAVVKMNKSIA